MTTLEEALKTDLAFTDDFGVTASGDFDIVSGLANLKEALLRRIMTKPGTLVHRPDFGIGLQDFKNSPTTLSVKRQLANRIAAQATDDPRIEEVVSVSVNSDDESPELLVITVRAEVVGYGEQTFEYTPYQVRIEDG